MPSESWCTDCKGYLPNSEFDAAELKKRSKHQRRCRKHALIHAEWKLEQKRLMERARREMIAMRKPRENELLREFARAARHKEQYDLLIARYKNAVGRGGLKYIKYYSSHERGDRYLEALPLARRALTPAKIRRILRDEGVEAALVYLKKRGPWWPHEILGPQPMSQYEQPTAILSRLEWEKKALSGAK